jgi:Mor family transcriptional regulator
MKPMEVRRNELLADAAAHAADAARSFGVPESTAEHIGAAVADVLAENWGGQNLSFPKDAAYKLCQREREILSAYREGVPVAKLALDYQMTMRGLRKLLHRAYARDDGSLMQIDLFDSGA